MADPVWLGHELPAAAQAAQAAQAALDEGLVRRIETDLALPLGSDGRVLTFRKAALVDVGAEESTVTGCRFAVAWQAASFAPLFPVFAGQLAVGPGALRLRGVYAPPGGAVGLVIDRAILHHVAYRTAGWFLDRLLERAEVTARWDARPS